jgi:hypothetical protein
MGETHASNGHTGMDALGLRAAWTAQGNGFTPSRNMAPCDYVFRQLRFVNNGGKSSVSPKATRR